MVQLSTNPDNEWKIVPGFLEGPDDRFIVTLATIILALAGSLIAVIAFILGRSTK